MDGELGFGCSHRHKRTHAEMDADRLTSPPWNRAYHRASASGSSSPSHPHVSGLHLPPLRNLPSSRTNRYPGDGMDYRRPLEGTSNNGSQVIDLTLDDAGPSQSSDSSSRTTSSRESQPPRLNRDRIDVLDIIDVDQEEGQPIPIPDSPEIEFISSRAIAPPRQPQRDPHVNVDLTDDDFEIISENTRRPIGGRTRTPMGRALQEILGADADNYNMLYLGRAFARRAHAAEQEPRPPRRAAPGRPRHRHIHFGFRPPIDMDFQMVGFDMGVAPEEEPPAPTYTAPEAAPEGFTRSPAEGDVLVCPNCDRELCTGDSDVQKQVWIVKGCGHVYCGECTTNRSRSNRTKKGKEKADDVKLPEPFKICVVDGCDKKCHTKTSMIQVFL